MTRPLAIAAAAVLSAAPLAAQQVGDRLPTDFVLRNLGGRETSLAAGRGGVRVVNVWATWCPPCRAELPSLAALADSLRGDGIAVHAVAVDRPGAVARFVAGLAEAPPVLVEHERFPREWGRWALPVTYVLGPDDRLLFIHRGAARWDAAEVVASLRQLAAGEGVD